MTPERRSGYILGGIALIEGAWVGLNAWSHPDRFIAYLGFAAARTGTTAGWIVAAAVVIAFVLLAARLPSVRATMFRASWLKALGLAVAVTAGILEEVVFRKLLMDWVADQSHGATVQVLVSGLTFGAAHGVWGLFDRSVRAAVGATMATGVLGAGLAIVYIASGRSLAPCVAAHFLINALVEPGLVLAAARGEMNRRPDRR